MQLKRKCFKSNQVPCKIQGHVNHSVFSFKKWLTLLSVFFALTCQAQFYEEKPGPEFAIGVKVLKGNIQYGPKSFYITESNSIGLQALVRYDAPFSFFRRSEYQQRYMNFVVESGFIFCKANPFDSLTVNQITNTTTRERSKNPTYFPVYAGLYNRSAFSFGAEVFYWKGLGTTDIFGAKFISIGYNGKSFRLHASGEWYGQTKNTKNNGLIFSVDFLWKLILHE